MKFRTAFLALIAIYAINWIVLPLGIYGAFPWFDIPMHFAGGIATGMLGIAIHHAVTDKHHFKNSHFWYHVLFVAGFVMLIAVAWEFHEYIIDNTIGVWKHLSPSQPSIGDTMLDLFMGLVGGVSSVFIFKKNL